MHTVHIFYILYILYVLCLLHVIYILFNLYILYIMYILCTLCILYCYRTFQSWFWGCSFPSFSVRLRVFSQGNLRGRSLQGPRSATTPRLTYTTQFLGFFSLLCKRSPLLCITVRLYNIVGCIHGTSTNRHSSPL